MPEPSLVRQIADYGTPALLLFFFLVIMWRFVAPILRDIATEHVALIKDLRKVLSELRDTFRSHTDEIRTIRDTQAKILEEQQRMREVLMKGTRE